MIWGPLNDRDVRSDGATSTASQLLKANIKLKDRNSRKVTLAYDWRRAMKNGLNTSSLNNWSLSHYFAHEWLQIIRSAITLKDA